MMNAPIEFEVILFTGLLENMQKQLNKLESGKLWKG